jgi:hypothetical protein
MRADADGSEESGARGGGGQGFVSRVMSVFRTNDDPMSPASVIVSVQTQMEEYVDDPRYEPERQRWKHHKRGSGAVMMGTGM